MRTPARPPRDRVSIGIAAIAGALIAASVVLIGGGAPAAPTMLATLPAAMDTDHDGVVDGAELADEAPPTTPATSAAPPAPGSGPGVPVAGGPVADDPLTDGPLADGPAADGAPTPIDAVRGFVASLGAGDTASAYRLMHPRYRDAFGSFAEFSGHAPTGRFGPFAALGGAGYQSAVFDGGVEGEAVALVSVYGAVMRSGTPMTEAVSMVARKAASGWLVEVGGEGGSVFQTPAEPGAQVTAGDPLVFWTPSAELTEVLAVVDGEPRGTEVTELVDPSETAEVRIADYSPGGQQAAIGVLRADGSVDTVATYFVA